MRGLLAAALPTCLLLLGACDLPSWDTGPIEREYEEPEATLQNPPILARPHEGSFEASFFAWKFGGAVQCGTPALTPGAPPAGSGSPGAGTGSPGGAGDGTGTGNGNGSGAGAAGPGGPFPGVVGLPGGANQSLPITVSIMEGVLDACSDTMEEGDRLLTLEVSDISPGVYPIAQACVGPIGANAIFGLFHGQVLLTRRAAEGQITLQGLDDRNVLQGVYSIRFDGEASFTSGGFRVESKCF